MLNLRHYSLHLHVSLLQEYAQEQISIIDRNLLIGNKLTVEREDASTKCISIFIEACHEPFSTMVSKGH